jgi:transcriptional regulator with XRE-family HTH domain
MSTGLSAPGVSAKDSPTTALGPTLRFWRERATPSERSEDELPRRTPGLRREELSALAGVSSVYITQLEQGRATTPSEQVLRALAQALVLSPIERDHLFRLAGQPTPVDRTPPARAPEPVRASLAAFHSLPAAIYNVRWDIVSWNDRWVTLLGDPRDRAPSERNLVWRHFAELPSRLSRTEAQTMQFEREIVADLRQAAARYPNDGELQRFVQALKHVSSRFAELWGAHEVAFYRGDHKVVNHPEVGLMELDCVVVDPRVEDFHIAVFSPKQGSSSESSFERLFRSDRGELGSSPVLHRPPVAVTSPT